MINHLVPTEFYLGQNYPNPFKEKTVIKYCVAYKSKVQITVYNSEGKEIGKLIDEEKQPGTYEVEFSTCHSREGKNLDQGYYFYRMTAGDFTSEKKWLCINKLSGSLNMKSLLQTLFFFLLVTQTCFGQWYQPFSRVWTVESNQPMSFFGLSVAGVNKIEQGKIYSGLVLVGAPGITIGEEREGGAFLFRGGSNVLDHNYTLSDAYWSAESNVTELDGNIMFGRSVSCAGDLNGDGFEDIIIGAPFLNVNDLQDAGKVFVYYGSINGLERQPSWTAIGDRQFGHFGMSVASAGDINGDGYDDIIIGEPSCIKMSYDDPCEQQQGRTFVWFGSASGLGLSGTPANADWFAISDQVISLFGNQVASAGDVNGDGYSDIIVGSHFYSKDLLAENFAKGAAFIWYGGSEGLGNFGTPSNADWIAEGDQKGCFMGMSVASAGDINNDGYDDIIIGSSGYDNDFLNEGAAFAWYGSPEGLGPFGTPMNAGWKARSQQTDALLGWCVGSAGDINNDGFDDIFIGVPRYNFSRHFEEGGAVFVWYGGINGLDGMGLPINADWDCYAEMGNSYFGHSVAGNIDFTNDGVDDVVVGAYHVTNPEEIEGKVYVYNGPGSLGPKVVGPVDVGQDLWDDILRRCFQSPGEPTLDYALRLGMNCPPVLNCLECFNFLDIGMKPELPEVQQLLEMYRTTIPILQQFPLSTVDKNKPMIDLSKIKKEKFFSSMHSFNLKSDKAIRLRNSLLKSLENYNWNEKISYSTVEKIFETLNAIDLDIRLSNLHSKNILKGISNLSNTGGVLAAKVYNAKKDGNLTIKVEPGLPCYNESFQTGWPVAQYIANFDGELSGESYVVLEFYLDDFKYQGPISHLRVLQWDGTKCLDITTTIDVNDRIIRARTNEMSTYFIVSIKDSKLYEFDEKFKKSK